MRDWNDDGPRGGGFGRGGGGRFGNERSMTPPVRENEEVDVTIESVGEKGDGMAKVQGFVLFVPGTKAGDRVRVKVTRVLAKVGFAQMIGPAQSAAETKKEAPKQAESFDPKEELDSEDFGDESAGDGAEDSSDDMDDSMDDEEMKDE